jgi:thiol-disulfide isomerase/thioredoxin
MILTALGMRFALAVLIAAACIGAWFLIRVLVLRRAGRASGHLERFSPGKPGVVFFTTPDCAACKTVQRPALRELERRLAGRIQVIEIDAVESPEIASSWSVLSVPTTFVLDPDGKPLHVNHGVASARKLFDQLALEA